MTPIPLGFLAASMGKGGWLAKITTSHAVTGSNWMNGAALSGSVFHVLPYFSNFGAFNYQFSEWYRLNKTDGSLLSALQTEQNTSGGSIGTFVGSGGSNTILSIGYRGNIYDANMNKLSSRNWPNSQYNTFAATGPTGNSYLTGYGSSIGLRVMKYDTSGTLQWKRYGGQSQNNCSIYVDSNDTAWVGTLGSSSGFVTGITSAGNLQLSVEILGQGFYPSTCSDGSNIYVTGVTQSTNPFKRMVVKLNSAGTIQWTRGITYGATHVRSTQSPSSNYITSDGLGGYYAVCSEWSGTGTSTIVKFDASGNTVWQRQISGVGSADCRVIADSSGLYISLITSTAGVSIAMKYPLSGATLGTFSVGGTNITISAGSCTIDTNAASGYIWLGSIGVDGASDNAWTFDSNVSTTPTLTKVNI